MTYTALVTAKLARFYSREFIKDHRQVSFREDGIEHPWQDLKRYTASRGNTWLHPEFYVGDFGCPCMDFTLPDGEPDSIIEPFDSVLPGFQERYFALGGKGGEVRTTTA